MKKILCALIGLFFLGKLAAQKTIVREKIDPEFLLIIDQKFQNDSIAKRSCNSKQKKKEAAKKAAAIKYDCIVYTRNAKRLRKKGIIINSELPEFVTAIATLDQIINMSVMQEVSFIKASGKDSLH